MANAAKKSGIVLAIRSGFRSHSKQKDLYRRFRRGWGHMAARPGYSNHQNGQAVDVDIEDWEYVGGAKHHARRTNS